jgi:phosphoribosylformylglycinamidine cyclo-ligase
LTINSRPTRKTQKKYSYAEAGVDREVRANSKTTLRVLRQTFKLYPYGRAVKLPYGYILPFGGKRYLDLEIEGVGTKVLVAQLANKYDTIGIDGVAMAVNDVIRSGANPLAIADNIHAQVSDPKLINELIKGIAKGAEEAKCIVPSGEIGDVAEIIMGVTERKGFDIIVACIGELEENKIIWGNNIEPSDAIIGLRSTGLHSNGITLARKVLFKQWGGKYDAFDVPDGFDKEIVFEVLEPTEIYAKPLRDLTKKMTIKGAVHITGDAYLKFDRLMLFSKRIGFEFDNFNPHPIFDLIQQTAIEVRGKISDAEMLKTFNMGWGFAVIVDRKNAEATIDCVEKTGVKAELIGHVTATGKIVARYKDKKIVLK